MFKRILLSCSLEAAIKYLFVFKCFLKDCRIIFLIVILDVVFCTRPQHGRLKIKEPAEIAAEKAKEREIKAQKYMAGQKALFQNVSLIPKYRVYSSSNIHINYTNNCKLSSVQVNFFLQCLFTPMEIEL